MCERLVQRSGFVRRRFTLVAEGIRVTESTLTEGETVTVPYEVVFGESFEVWSSSRKALIACIVMAALTVLVLLVNSERFAWLVWGTGAAIAGAYYLSSRHDQIGFFNDDSRLVFFRDKPTAAALDELLVEICRRARERVRARILPLGTTGDPRVDRDRARALRDKGIISAQECAEIEHEVAWPSDRGKDGPLEN